MADKKKGSTENIGIRLAQNLRDDLIFDLFAPDEEKQIVNDIKEEELKRTYKRLWRTNFCILIKFAMASAETDEWTEEDDKMSQCLADAVYEATKKIIPKYPKFSPNILFMLRGVTKVNITENDFKMDT